MAKLAAQVGDEEFDQIPRVRDVFLDGTSRILSKTALNRPRVEPKGEALSHRVLREA